MLKSGSEHLESLRDGRRIFIGRELVDDVVTHPAFRNAAKTVAAIYDLFSWRDVERDEGQHPARRGRPCLPAQAGAPWCRRADAPGVPGTQPEWQGAGDRRFGRACRRTVATYLALRQS